MHRQDAGFTLVEMLIAMAVMLLILAGVFQVFNPAQGSFRTQPEVADMQQRLRVGNERLYNGLVVAGAGIYSGQALGTLGQFFAPVLPYLVGPLHNDPASGVFFRTDAITVFHVPTTASQCTIRDKMPRPSSEVKVNAEPGCPAADPLCGFEEGMRVIIFDATGSFDFFTITQVQSDALHLQHRPPINPADFSKAYDVGATISQINTDAYYWRQDPATNTYQLMHYDLFQNDMPLIDDVVNLRFDYMGEAAPPVLRAPVTDPIGPWTSYGPKPPALGVDVASDTLASRRELHVHGRPGIRAARVSPGVTRRAGHAHRANPGAIVGRPLVPRRGQCQPVRRRPAPGAADPGDVPRADRRGQPARPRGPAVQPRGHGPAVGPARPGPGHAVRRHPSESEPGTVAAWRPHGPPSAR